VKILFYRRALHSEHEDPCAEKPLMKLR